jgi:1-deoxy-D-xylulose-5-phosphate reductoisomerase
MHKRKILILGSTGSIGKQALEVIDQNRNLFEIDGLVCNDNLDLIKNQAKYFGVKKIGIGNKDKYKKEYKNWYWGDDEVDSMIRNSKAEIVIMSISGAKSLKPTLAAIESGKDVALASKEVMVLAGKLVMEKVKKNKVNLLPVDSEHSAIWQCLRVGKREEIEKVILTCSGGPFLDLDKNEFENIKPEDALKHPNWKMGPRITIDCSTLLNKGLEFIEAKYLFNLKYEQIEIVIHPQSFIHSAVQYQDGSIIAQIANKDMRLPIQYALSYPKRWPNNFERINWFGLNINFEKPNLDKFPALYYALEACKIGGSMTVVLNAADEIAVSLFLNRKIKFNDIPKIIEKIMKKHKVINSPNLNQILKVDKWAREEAMII